MTVETATAIEPLEAEWDELADRIGAKPWSRPGWIGAWSRAFGRGRLELLTVRRDGRLAGVLPLVPKPGRRAASPTNWHTPEFQVVAEDDAARGELLAAVFARGLVDVRLDFLDDPAPVRAAAESAGYRILQRAIAEAPYLRLEGDFEAYLAGGGIGKKPLKELSRRRARLEERGKLEFSVEDGAEGLEALLREGFAIEGSGWKDESGTAIRSRADTLGFYTEVARWAERRGILRLLFLRLDGRPIGFVYGIEDGGALYDVKGGYDVEFRTSSPGKLLAYELIRYAYESGLDTFEFLGTAEPFKLEWTREVRERTQVHAFAPVAGLPVFAAYAHGRPLARRARQAWRRATTRSRARE